jgi:hypothetical protein
MKPGKARGVMKHARAMIMIWWRVALTEKMARRSLDIRVIFGRRPAELNIDFRSLARS